jgi:hypothetical protein
MKKTWSRNSRVRLPLRILGCLVQSKWITGIFQSPESEFKKSAILPNSTIPEDNSPKNGQIAEDDSPRLAKSWLMASQNIKRISWNQQPKAIFHRWVIPACGKPELIGIFKLNFWGLKKPGRSLWLDIAIPEVRTKWLYVPLVSLSPTRTFKKRTAALKRS